MLAELAEWLGWVLLGASETAAHASARRSRRRAFVILTLAAALSLVLGLIAFTDVL